jgi:hypothetical protein
MGLMERAWDAVQAALRMEDRLDALAERVVAHQTKIEQLTERVIRLETALEIALGSRREGGPPRLPQG